ncbi:MAG: nucleotidyltransferase family protein [Fibrobacter sp.]|nr:nucleotidyltransferase family protein [Fibrobacter sp.]
MKLDSRYKAFFALLRYSLGIGESFAHRLSAEEWGWMREEAIRQALVGVLYMGVKNLPEDLRPPRLLLMQWAFDAENIRGTNQKVNEVAAKLTRMFKKRGRESVILKGPANALLYPDPFARSCGDVDIMLPGGRDSVVKLLTEMELMEGATVNSLHAELAESLFSVSVEVHYVASNTYSPFQNRRLHLQAFAETLCPYTEAA